MWHHRDFRRLWIGDTVSQLGTSVNRLALPLLTLLVLHASTLEVGLLTAFETLAFLLIGLPAEAWVDRIRSPRVSTVFFDVGYQSYLPTSASAVGGLLGAAVTARVARKIEQGPAICWSAAVAVLAGLTAPFVHRDWTFVLLLVGLFVFGAAGVIYNITQVSSGNDCARRRWSGG